jgi:hypothetical protein
MDTLEEENAAGCKQATLLFEQCAVYETGAFIILSQASKATTQNRNTRETKGRTSMTGRKQQSS